MFGYSTNGTDKIRALKVAQRRSAQERWPFLTTLDLSGLHNPVQLARLIQDRSAVSRGEADAQVEIWMRGYNRRVLGRGALPSFITFTPTLRPRLSLAPSK
ncbi:hypothetical protein SAMN02983003_3106 [Devosia enhydra]|uniref:Uncharacterized protein n=1 Tax=Devosia enhydra TaxID=665118 RepID=A0A1K2I0N6_9HYPH|nr:hypothetical protein SAMN02983003_3106 [Devosia enhydra]